MTDKLLLYGFKVFGEPAKCEFCDDIGHLAYPFKEGSNGKTLYACKKHENRGDDYKTVLG